MAAHRKSDRRRDDLYAGGLRNCAWPRLVCGDAYVARLRLYHFGFLSRTNKKVAIKSPVPTSAHTSDVWPSGILPRVRRKMPIINGTTTRKIASFFILFLSGRYLASWSN